jgi:NAD(P)H-dependent flavin oxidoreductase YrpB (nitropropane dioxygenase family)
MRTPLSERLNLEFPIFAFSHCRDVVAAVSAAGGFGVLGGANFSPEELENELSWLDEHSDGKPYGVDLVFPVTYKGDDTAELLLMIPAEHKEFVHGLEERFGIPPRQSVDTVSVVRGHERSREQWRVAMQHPIKLLASALGPTPSDIQTQAHDLGILTAGLVGDVKHAERHLAAGTDILIAQGSEAGGHCGDIGTFVLVPQIVDLVKPTPVLAAGGIGNGRQIAAALALGAEGVWTGSIWLTTVESDVHPKLKRKLVAASSRDTIRSKCRTGKMVRQLRTPWVEAWEAKEAPSSLPAPLQQLLVRDATISAVEHGIDDALGTPVGQVVGIMDGEPDVRRLVQELVTGFVDSASRLTELLKN